MPSVSGRAFQIASAGGPFELVQRESPEPGPGHVRIRVQASGTGMDSEDTLNFSALTGVKPQIELYPLDKAPQAFERMESGKARFRVVITTGA